jgi:hypothetical protein
MELESCYDTPDTHDGGGYGDAIQNADSAISIIDSFLETRQNEFANFENESDNSLFCENGRTVSCDRSVDISVGHVQRLIDVYEADGDSAMTSYKKCQDGPPCCKYFEYERNLDDDSTAENKLFNTEDRRVGKLTYTVNRSDITCNCVTDYLKPEVESLGASDDSDDGEGSEPGENDGSDDVDSGASNGDDDRPAHSELQKVMQLAPCLHIVSSQSETQGVSWHRLLLLLMGMLLGLLSAACCGLVSAVWVRPEEYCRSRPLYSMSSHAQEWSEGTKGVGRLLPSSNVPTELFMRLPLVQSMPRSLASGLGAVVCSPTAAVTEWTRECLQHVHSVVQTLVSGAHWWLCGEEVFFRPLHMLLCRPDDVMGGNDAALGVKVERDLVPRATPPVPLSTAPQVSSWEQDWRSGREDTGQRHLAEGSLGGRIVSIDEETEEENEEEGYVEGDVEVVVPIDGPASAETHTSVASTNETPVKHWHRMSWGRSLVTRCSRAYAADAMSASNMDTCAPLAAAAAAASLSSSPGEEEEMDSDTRGQTGGVGVHRVFASFLRLTRGTGGQQHQPLPSSPSSLPSGGVSSETESGVLSMRFSVSSSSAASRIVGVGVQQQQQHRQREVKDNTIEQGTTV